MELVDWLVLTISFILVSYFGLRKGNETSQNFQDRLIGSNMPVWAVALSVCSGFISSISLIGFPAEVYYFGIMVVWLILTYFVAFPIVAYLFLPIFYKLKLHSIYEYMELRFGRDCRILGLACFFFQTVLYTAVALYAPSMAMTSITGITLSVSISFTALLAAVYISFGGARAGIHTSAIQMAMIFVALLAIALVNCFESSLIDAIKNAYAGHRLNFFDFRIDPTVRHTFWSLLFGGIVNICCLFAGNQLSVQRYISMPSLESAQMVVLYNIPCNSAILVCYVLIGLLIYNRYHLCDPGLSNINELLPQFVLDSFSHLPGMTGLFIAAVYGAAISTLSASFTAISTVILTEICQLYAKYKSRPMSNDRVLFLTKIMPFFVAICIGMLAYFCQYLRALALQVAFSVFGGIGGPVLGTFFVGFFIPYAKGRSGVVGLAVSLFICLFLAFGAIYYEVKPNRLPVNTMCNETITLIMEKSVFHGIGKVTARNGWFTWVSSISYQYYSVIGVISNVFVACLYQYIFGNDDKKKIQDDLLSPLVYNSSTVFEEEMEKIDGTIAMEVYESECCQA